MKRNQNQGLAKLGEKVLVSQRLKQSIEIMLIILD